MISYARLAIIGGVVFVVFGFGWYMGNSRYVAYKKEVEAVAQSQEEKVKSIRTQQELVNKATKENYEAKLSAIKSYYGGMRLSSSGQMPSLSDSSTGANVEPSKLILDCAYTTQQLVSLQDWVRDQVSVK